MAHQTYNLPPMPTTTTFTPNLTSGGAGAGMGGYAPFLKAMEETQRRAAEDRAKAIQLVTDAMNQATTGPEYAKWAAMVQQLTEAPETITPEVAGQMYEKGRVPAEAQTQKMLRDVQESYYGRGIPGGAMKSAVEQVGIGKMGTLSELASNVALERAKRRREDLISAGGEASKLAQYVGQTKMGGAKTLSDLYGQTITSIPRL